MNKSAVLTDRQRISDVEDLALEAESEMTRTQLRQVAAELRQRLQARTHEAHTDRLTRLDNRLGLERRAVARGGWFVLCDLNGFKKAQDRHPAGHAYGDELLVSFADYLLGLAVEGERVAARVGGDEFVVWVQGSRAAADYLAGLIRCWISGDKLVTVSVGVGATMAEADAAMYREKRARRGALRRLLASVGRWL